MCVCVETAGRAAIHPHAPQKQRPTHLSSFLTASSLFLSLVLCSQLLLSCLLFCCLAVLPPVRVAFQGRILLVDVSVDRVGGLATLPTFGWAADVDASAGASVDMVTAAAAAVVGGVLAAPLRRKKDKAVALRRRGLIQSLGAKR